MSDSYIERIKREGPLPKVDDDSELVGDDDKAGENRAAGAGREHGGDFVTLPAPGAGSFPVPTVAGASENEKGTESEDGPEEG